MGAIKWVGSQSNRIASAVRAFMYMAVALTWTSLTTEQIGTILLFTEAVLGLFVETNTVSKVRVGERIDEGVNKIITTGTGAGTGSGVIPPKVPSILFALALGAAVAGCGPTLPPTTSPEAKIAIRGTQVIEGLRATLPQIKALTCQPGVSPPVCIPPQDALRVVNTIDLAGDAAIELGRVLIVIDAATNPDDKTKGLTNARMILAAIQDMLTKSILVPQGTEIQARLQAIFSTVSALLFTVM